MSRFSSPAAALSYFALGAMGIVALRVAVGRIEETVVRRFVLPPVLLALAAAGIREYRRRQRAGQTGADADQ